MGFYKEEYTEKTMKIAKVPVKTYEFGYTFIVGEKEYDGLQTLKELPTEPMVQVKYLASDPTINAANPEAQLASLGQSEGRTSTLLIGLGLVAAGLGLGFYRYKSVQKAKAA